MNKEKIISSKELEELMNELKKAAELAASSMSENYKRTLVYTLLNAIKANDQNKFLWILLRAINDPHNEKFVELSKKIGNFLYHSKPSQIFEKWGYSIILGIMSSTKSE